MAASESDSGRRAVIRRELAWHEEEQDARRRVRADQILYKRPAFVPVVEAGMAFLQAQPGERVLELGCGVGAQAAELAARGLRVVAIELSFRQAEAAHRLVRERVPDADIHFIQANAEELPFAAGSFRLVYGKAILHHLDLGAAAQEVHRILAPEGRASFAEPLADHFAFRLARRLTPRLRTLDERPMSLAELERFAGRFRARQIEAFFLLAPAAYVLRWLPIGEGAFRAAHALLNRIDKAVLSRFAGLRKWAWYSVLNVEK